MKKMLLAGMATLAFFNNAGARRPPPYRELGTITSPLCAFLSVNEIEGEKALFATSFSRRTPGQINWVPSIGDKLGDVDGIQQELAAGGLVWPNDVVQVPEQVMGPNYVANFGGFIGTPAGSINFINPVTHAIHKVTVDQSGMFYHTGVFRDVDGDGHLDLVTAKTNFPFGPFPPLNSRLVWLRNPGDGSFPWAENLLFSGPDIHFRLHDFDGDGKEEVVAAIFIRRKVSVFYNVGDWRNPADWRERVVDNTIGSPFDVHVTDLNRDGKVDLLVTNHENSVETSAVYGYEVPSNLASGDFPRHLLAMNFPTTQPGPGQFSPGSAQPFHPSVHRSQQKPLIMVSGDGNQRAHMLVAESENPRDWSYTLDTFLFANATVGAIAIDDVDNDGYSEVFVPSYDNGEIYVYTFSVPPQ